MIDQRTALTDAALSWDRARPRSRQKHAGVSDIGTCLRRAGYMRHGVEPTNEKSSSMAAVLGTWDHEAAHATMQAAYGTVHEVGVAHPSGLLTGHLDTLWLSKEHVGKITSPRLLDHLTGYEETTLEDLKTKADDRMIDQVRMYGAPEPHKRQVFTYSWLLSTFGAVVPQRGSTVGTRFVRSLGPIRVDAARIRYLGRDRGAEHVEDLEVTPARLAEAEERFRWVQESKTPEDLPREQRGPVLSYECDGCPFLTACWGVDRISDDGVWPQAVKVVEGETTFHEQTQQYLTGMALERDGKRLKEDAKAVLSGVSEPTEFEGAGTVAWRQPRAKAPEEDVDAMRRILEDAGVEIPMKDGGKTTRAISVRPPKTSKEKA